VSDREQPHDRDAERAVLGAILIAPDALQNVLGDLQPDDFYDVRHSEIFTAALTLFNTGTPVDPVNVLHELTRRGNAARIGGAPYLHDLTATVPTAVNIDYWGRIVREKARLRRLSAYATRLNQIATSEEVDSADAIASAYADLDHIGGLDGTRSVAVNAEDSLTETLAHIEEAGRNNGARGIPTGFVDLDHLINGLRPGQMITIAARPGIGKSTIALDICRNASLHHGKSSLIFSLEMSHIETMTRLLSAHARVPLANLLSGDLSDEEWQRIGARIADISTARLFIDDSPGTTLGEIKAKSRRIQATEGLDLIVVDYLQLMSSGKRVESRQQEVSEFSRGLKLLAKELQVPVIAVSQLNRGSENRSDKRPQMSDLRESGAIEQDSDLILLLFREDAVDPDTPNPGEAEVIVAKQRSGPTGVAVLGFQGRYSRFVNTARDHQQQ
jgi:replicative DNA helicase